MTIFSCFLFSQERFPDEWSRRSVDKLAYRYPRGESYLDVIARLEPIIIEMERHHEPVRYMILFHCQPSIVNLSLLFVQLLIIAHQGILRIIYAFYKGHTRSEAPYLSIPLNSVVELVPGAFDCKEKVRSLAYYIINAIITEVVVVVVVMMLVAAIVGFWLSCM